jgi:hypothetical protein
MGALLLGSSGSSNSTATSNVSFEDFYLMRESERQGGCKPQRLRKKRKKTTTTSALKKTNVEIKVGLTIQTYRTIRTRRGKMHVITVSSTATKEHII